MWLFDSSNPPNARPRRRLTAVGGLSARKHGLRIGTRFARCSVREDDTSRRTPVALSGRGAVVSTRFLFVVPSADICYLVTAAWR